MRARVVIIHGSYGSPFENWFPWLAREVRRAGYEAYVPWFPSPEEQSLEKWREAFDVQIGPVTADMVFVGHSLGPGFILDLVENAEQPVAAIFLVSGFLGELGLEDFDPINSTFVCRDFDWERIRENAGHVRLYNSDDDPYVPLERGKELSEKLGGELSVVRGGGHINAGAGFREYPQLFEDVRALLNRLAEETS